jgi:hypothetical protein
MNSLPIPLMSNENMQTANIEKPNFNALDFTQEGERIKIGIIKISEIEQLTFDRDTKVWSKKMETVTKVNPKTGVTSTTTKPTKGFVIEMFRKDDPECVVRTLKLNSKAGVRYMEKYVSDRKEPISTFIPDEDLVLEKVDNGAGMYPSVLPIGA